MKKVQFPLLTFARQYRNKCEIYNINLNNKKYIFAQLIISFQNASNGNRKFKLNGKTFLQLLILITSILKQRKCLKYQSVGSRKLSHSLKVSMASDFMWKLQNF